MKAIAEMEKWVAEAKTNMAAGKEVSIPPAVAPHPNEDFRGRCEVSCLYNGMINPLTPFAIEGVLWYQAENNGSEQQTYIDTLSGMAVAIDVGNPKDIHPKNKRDIGERLALWALAKGLPASPFRTDKR